LSALSLFNMVGLKQGDLEETKGQGRVNSD
jgi:hypothetical protein